MARTSLPPGFRFHPTDVELVMYYLKRKIMGKRLHFEAIAEVNIYKFSPWDLPDKSCLKSKDLEWFFFCPMEKKYGSGARMKRGAEKGFWKTTGKDREVRFNENVVGMVRTLVFHRGRATQGQRTDWVIHEYRILDEQLAAAGLQDMYVICKVFQKNGLGPRNGAQYGVFNEADWDDDDDDIQNQVKSLLPDGPSFAASTLPENQSCSVITGMVNAPGPSLFEAGPSHYSCPSVSEEPVGFSNDEILHLSAMFTDDSVLLNDNGNHENQDGLNQNGKNKCLPCLDGNDIYNGLYDLNHYWGTKDEGRVNFAGTQKDDYLWNYKLPQDDILELNDLEVPLNHPAEVNEMEQMQFDYLFGPYAQGNTEQLFFGGNFSGMDPCTSCLGHLSVPPEGSKRQGSCSDVLQGECSKGDGGYNAAAYTSDFTGRHLRMGANDGQS